MTDPFFRAAEDAWLEPIEPPMCPACGSIDISADERCTHCGTNVDERNANEKRQNVS